MTITFDSEDRNLREGKSRVMHQARDTERLLWAGPTKIAEPLFLSSFFWALFAAMAKSDKVLTAIKKILLLQEKIPTLHQKHLYKKQPAIIITATKSLHYSELC